MTTFMSPQEQALADELAFAEWVDGRIDYYFSHADVSYEGRSHLRQLLKHYAKMAYPFRACVRDNTKRFGPGRVEKVCATIKDMIRGSHRWREVHASDDVMWLGLSNDAAEGRSIILSLSDQELGEMKEVLLNGGC